MKGMYSGGHGMHTVRIHYYPGPRNAASEKLKKATGKIRRQIRRSFAENAVKHLALDEDSLLVGPR